MSKRRDIAHHLDRGGELADRVRAVLDRVLDNMDTARRGWPAAARYDSPRAGTHENVTFCEEHERERCGCGGGTSYPSVVDSTGSAAMEPDRALMDERAFEQAARQFFDAASRLEALAHRYASRPPTDRERRETLAANESGRECWSCNRVGAWEDGERAVEVDGESRVLGWWCRRWVRETSRLPTVDEVRQHHAGRQVRRPGKGAVA